jgi:SAM-dependent methyltransferase
MPNQHGVSSDVESMAGSSIPVYLKFPYQRPPDHDELRSLNEIGVRAGWRAAVEEVYRSIPGDIRYVTDPAHHRFVELLPLTSESIVLELGPGQGQNTTALAQRAAFVHAVEIDPDRARFATLRCHQEGLSNVAIVCGGDDCRFPYYEDGMFDGVVVNLVLEWCGQRDPAASALEMQQRFLKECWRVLKPGGWFYLNTKNRFGLRYLLGRPDEHTFGWPFGQALPRWLLDVLLRIRGKSGPGGRGLIHSYGAIHRLLGNAGFTNLRGFWPVPEFRFPREFVPVDPASIRAARRRPGFFQPTDPQTTRRLMPFVPAPLVKHVMLGLVFLAEKPA